MENNLNPFTPTQQTENVRQSDLDLQADYARAGATVFLAESSRKGYIVDRKILQDFIEQYSKEVSQLKKELYSDIRLAMGWIPQSDVLDELPEEPVP